MSGLQFEGMLHSLMYYRIKIINIRRSGIGSGKMRGCFASLGFSLPLRFLNSSVKIGISTAYIGYLTSSSPPISSSCPCNCMQD